MQALLIIAHGSSNQVFNQDIENLAGTVSNRVGDEQLVGHAFMEIAKPDIQQGIDDLAGRGASIITILPYFLARGNHVTRDIPELVDAAAKDHPGVELRVLPHIGASPGITDMVLQHLTATGPAATAS